MSIASPEPPPAFDESALAQDLVRLLGAELQRVKRELVDARMQVEKLEKAASASNLTVDDSNRSLLEENKALKGELSRKREKYKEAKEARKVLQVKLQEFTEREKARPVAFPSAFGIVDESELHELQKQNIVLKSQLQESDNYAKELLHQLQEIKKDKAQSDQALQEATSRLRKYECNSPWDYILNATSNHPDSVNLLFRPFSKCSNIRTLLDNLQSDTKEKLGHNMSKLLIRPQPVRLMWSEERPQHSISIDPALVYKPMGKDRHVWVHEPTLSEKEGDVHELLYQRDSYWYYCGTYRIAVVHTWENGQFFRSLDYKDQISILGRTIMKQELVPPIIKDLIKSLYETGILNVVCTIYERLGYDEDLHDALQRLGACSDGPVLDPMQQIPRNAGTSLKRKASEL